MRIHWLQHVPFEGLGSMEPWLIDQGAKLSPTALFGGEHPPDPADVEALIVMGGPMSVNDEAVHPWLAAEKRLVADVIAADKPVVGICLGAQLIAAACGARVFSNEHREIGWLDVELTAGAKAHPLGKALPDRFTAFHWHGETFELPAGAVHLAHSAACRHQAFAMGSNVVGLQFHLETTAASAQALITHCPEDLQPGPYVQQAAEMLDEPARFAAANRLMGAVLTWFIGLIH